MTNRSKVQQFLQLNHISCFGHDYLSRYLDVPLAEVKDICDALVLAGYATRPKWTDYVQGVPVDWTAVHEGRAERPEWSIEPTYAESLRRAQLALERIVASLREHDALTCENCKAYEREREERGVRA